jgi:hypothetical protein
MVIFKGGRQKTRDKVFELIDGTGDNPEGRKFTKRLVEIYLGYFLEIGKSV